MDREKIAREYYYQFKMSYDEMRYYYYGKLSALNDLAITLYKNTAMSHYQLMTIRNVVDTATQEFRR